MAMHAMGIGHFWKVHGDCTGEDCAPHMRLTYAGLSWGCLFCNRSDIGSCNCLIGPASGKDCSLRMADLLGGI